MKVSAIPPHASVTIPSQFLLPRHRSVSIKCINIKLCNFQYNRGDPREPPQLKAMKDSRGVRTGLCSNSASHGSIISHHFRGKQWRGFRHVPIFVILWAPPASPSLSPQTHTHKILTQTGFSGLLTEFKLGQGISSPEDKSSSHARVLSLAVGPMRCVVDPACRFVSLWWRSTWRQPSLIHACFFKTPFSDSVWCASNSASLIQAFLSLCAALLAREYGLENQRRAH